MPSILTGRLSTNAPIQVSVGVASAQAVAYNDNRVGIIVTNLATGTIYLGFGTNTAVVGSGISLLPGGTWSMDDYTYTKDAVNAIAHAAASALAVQEFIVIN